MRLLGVPSAANSVIHGDQSSSVFGEGRSSGSHSLEKVGGTVGRVSSSRTHSTDNNHWLAAIYRQIDYGLVRARWVLTEECSLLEGI